MTCPQVPGISFLLGGAPPTLGNPQQFKEFGLLPLFHFPAKKRRSRDSLSLKTVSLVRAKKQSPLLVPVCKNSVPCCSPLVGPLLVEGCRRRAGVRQCPYSPLFPPLVAFTLPPYAVQNSVPFTPFTVSPLPLRRQPVVGQPTAAGSGGPVLAPEFGGRFACATFS